MPYNVAPLAYTGAVRAKWLDDGRFWYRDYKSDGWDYVIVDPANKTRTPAFDQAKLADALKAADAPVKRRLAASCDHRVLFSEERSRASLGAAGDLQRAPVWMRSQRRRCLHGGQDSRRVSGATEAGARLQKFRFLFRPTRQKAAFIRDFNLWVRDLTTGKETQLTTDGVKDYGYATDNAGWKQTDNPILLWSPDSKKIATFQQDQRKTGEMYLVPVTNGHPILKAWKYPLVGDAERYHDRTGDRRRRFSEGDSPENAARSTPLDAVRRSSLAAAPPGRMCNGAPTATISHSSPPRGTTGRSGCAWPTPKQATFAK